MNFLTQLRTKENRKKKARPKAAPEHRNTSKLFTSSAENLRECVELRRQVLRPKDDRQQLP